MALTIQQIEMSRTTLRQSALAKILGAVAYRNTERTISVEKRAVFNLSQRFDNGWGRMAEEEQHKIAAAKFIEVNYLTGILRCQEPRRRFADADHFPTPKIWRPNCSSNRGIA
jgi:hypothetical protein